MMFEQLKGIEKGREIKNPEKTNFEILLDACDETVKKYTAGTAETDEQISKKYAKIYGSLKKKLPEFTEQDLTSLIYAKANKEYDGWMHLTLGLCTGVLLHILTERNRKKGKKTKFCIKGHGNKFDYLFYFAKEVDELIADYFTGKNICANIASWNGKANKIILNNNKGDNIALDAGSYKGNINTLIIKNNEGDYAAYDAGNNQGNVDNLLISNNRGDRTAANAGSNSGNIGNLLINNNKGDNTAANAGRDKGNIKTLIINNNKGNYMAGNAGSDQGNINTLLINNNKGNNPAWNAGLKGNINKISLNNLTGENTTEGTEAKQIITGKEALQEYKEIIQLLNSFKNKTPKEIITITEEITKCLNN